MTRVFVSYSHRDEGHRNELEKHLALLKRQGALDLWSDHCIRPGEAFDPAIAAALEAADIVLLLISADRKGPPSSCRSSCVPATGTARPSAV